MNGSAKYVLSILLSFILPHSVLANDCEFKQAEVKVPVSIEDASKLLIEWDLAQEAPENTALFFFDSEKLELSKKGWILRQRHKEGENVETTLKYRDEDPIKLKGIAKLDLEKDEEIKCEVDANINSQAYSVSISGQNSAVVEIPALNDSQIRLFKKNYKDELSPLMALGPIYSKKWSYKTKNDLIIDIEIWQIGRNNYFAETSVKVDTKEQKKATKLLLKTLEKAGVAPATQQQTKTAFALKYFSNKAKLKE